MQAGCGAWYDTPPSKRGATVEQLATHTSGLVVKGTALAGESRAAFVRDVQRAPRESAPGARYRYSNAGFSLLAAIIERVTDRRYEEYVRERGFAPAGMRTAVFRDEVPPDDTLFARGYTGTPAALEPGPPNPYVWGTRGAGGVWSTVGEMYRWLLAVEAGRVVPEPQRRLLFSPPPPPALEAYGWRVEPTGPRGPHVRKGGGSDDFASQLLYYPRERVVIVWASNNLRQRWRQTLNRALPALAFGGAPAALPPVAALPRGALERGAARYVAGRDTLELRAGTGYLYAATAGLGVPGTVMFFPQDRATFTAYDPPSGDRFRLLLGRPRAGSVTVALPDGRRVVARRVPPRPDPAPQ